MRLLSNFCPDWSLFAFPIEVWSQTIRFKKLLYCAVIFFYPPISMLPFVACYYKIMLSLAVPSYNCLVSSLSWFLMRGSLLTVVHLWILSSLTTLESERLSNLTILLDFTILVEANTCLQELRPPTSLFLWVFKDIDNLWFKYWIRGFSYL